MRRRGGGGGAAGASAVARRALLAGCVAVTALVVLPAAGDSGERGYPLVHTLVPDAPGADVQTFDVAVDPRGFVYAANGGGVLIHDGAWWRRVPVGEAVSAFSLAIGADGRVVVGGVGEIGYLTSQRDGEGDAGAGPRFVSLVDRLPEELHDFSQVLRVVTARRGFVFATESWLVWWDGGERLVTLGTHPGVRPFTIPFRAGEEVYAWGPERGLERIALDGDTPSLEAVAGGELFVGRRVDAVLGADGGALLVSVRGEGLFLLADGAATPFAPQASRWTVDHRVLSSLRLADGRWALGSVLGGLLIVAPDGRVEQTIDSRVGLADDLVYGLATDRDGSLWLALNTDMARLDVASPLSLVDRRAGLVGSAYYAVRHRGELWVATAAGLFVLDAGSGTADRPPVAVRPVPDLPPGVWSLLSIGDDLLAGTASGLFQVDERGRPRAVRGVPDVTVYALAASPVDPVADPALAWAGTSEGLHRLTRGGGNWRAGDHRALPSPVRAVVERDGVVWCSTELDGIFGFAVPAAGAPLGPPVHQAETEGETNLHPVGDRILVTSGGRVLALDEARGAVVEEPGLDRLGRHEFVYDLAEDAAGNLWLNTRPPSVAQAEPGGGWAVPRPLVEVTARAVESLLAEADGVVWMMSEEGVYRWAGSPAGRGGLPAPRIAAVTAGDGETLFAAGVGEAALTAPPALELPPDVRRLRIAVAPLAFRPGLAYQTRLDPVDDDWSAPAAEPFSELTRLPSGGYTYRVRTVGPGGEAGPETAWGFRVRAPWYRTPWALVLWVLVALGLVRGYAGLRSRALGRRAAELERRVSEQTVELRTTVDELRRTQRELEVANEQLQELSLSDDLTGVANRRRLQLSLDAEWGRSIRRQRPLAFVLLDLDHFKLLNDSRGHREGDRALQAVASYLDAAVQRPGDLLVRYGGEEFAVLLPDTDVQGALVLAERLREGVEELGLPHEGNPGGHVTASFGVASLVPTAGQRPGVLIEAADHALYRAKTEGRNLVRAEGQEGGASAAN